MLFSAAYFGPGSGASGYYQHTSTRAEGTGIQHVVLIMMENKQDSNIVGNPLAKYENYLISKYAFANNYHAISTKGLYDYLGLVDGSDSITNYSNECLPTHCYFEGSNLFSMMQGAGLSWKGYAESMPKPCSNGKFGPLPNQYWPWHTAIPYFRDIAQYCTQNDISLGNFIHRTGNFYNALQSNSFANFSMITPNVCDDMHTCPNGQNTIAIGDKWLSQFIPMIMNSSYYPSTVIFITMDNGPALSDPIPMIVIGPSNLVNQGQFNENYTHYSTLATIENIFSLGNLGRNDASATPMSAIIPSAA